MRQYVRHPADIPIRISVESVNLDSTFSYIPFNGEMLDVCKGGVSFEVVDYISIGSTVHVTIDSVSPIYNGTGEVVWCAEHQSGFEIGVRFVDNEEAFRSRMVQQICQIEVYKNRAFERDGRLLDGEQAAAEWIKKHALSFPAI